MPPGVINRPPTLLRCRHLAVTWWRLAFALDTRGLAAFRIGLGLTLVADCLLRFRTFPLMFAADGVFPPDALRNYQGTAATWSIALASDATSWAGTVLAMEGALGGLLALGWHTRVVTIAAWVVTISIVHRTAPATYAGDMWLLCMLFWSMFLPLAPSGRSMPSADRGGRNRPRLFPSRPQPSYSRPAPSISARGSRSAIPSGSQARPLPTPCRCTTMAIRWAC